MLQARRCARLLQRGLLGKIKKALAVGDAVRTCSDMFMVDEITITAVREPLAADDQRPGEATTSSVAGVPSQRRWEGHPRLGPCYRRGSQSNWDS